MESSASQVLCVLAGGPAGIGTLTTQSGRDRCSVEATVASLSQRDLVVRLDDGRIVLNENLGYDVASLQRLTPPPYTVFKEAVVDSTNDWARELLSDEGERVLAVAERQRGGRGRRGRVWRSPPGGIWASLGDARRLPPRTAWVEGLALSVAATDAIDALGIEATLKWPNDVIVRNNKVAGVLVQTTTAERRTRTIAGIGINANVPTTALPPEAISLQAVAGPVARAPVLAHIVRRFETYRKSPDTTIAAWRERCETLDREVRAELVDAAIEGTASDLTATGELVIETEAGSVTVRPERCRTLHYR